MRLHTILAATTSAVALAAMTACTPIITTARAEGLAPFAACSAYLDYMKGHAAEAVGPYGFSDGHPWLDGRLAAENSDGGESTAVTNQQPDYSKTNVQENGVAEPDLVKTNGSHIFAVKDGVLNAFAANDGDPELAGTLRLPGAPDNLLLHEDRLLALSTSGLHSQLGVAEDSLFPQQLFPQQLFPQQHFPQQHFPQQYSQTTKLVQIDISDPRDLKVTRSTEVSGRYLDARAVNGTARIVTSFIPTFDFVYPGQAGIKNEKQAKARNQRIIADTTLQDWLPQAAIDDEPKEPLVDCDRIMHPQEFAGTGLLTVLTIGIDSDQTVGDASSVVASGDLVYASGQNLYIATNAWFNWPSVDDAVSESASENYRTQIHQFDISDPVSSAYVASGTVEGQLLNQFSMSEHNGDLRVATTDFNWQGRATDQESYVTVLRPVGTELETVGRVGGLGRGEQIYAVRFLGDTGYVVTFRQTDPLYTLDLSTSESPKVVGELKIEGYSAYLHPISDDRLLGVGQDANSEGRTKGTQVSLFDVSDPANPKRLDQWSPGKGTYSEVEWDHHAFLYWQPTGTVALPVSHSATEARMAVLQVDGSQVSNQGELAHPNNGGSDRWEAEVQRSIVIGNNLYTLSRSGLMSNDLRTLEQTGWAPTTR